MSHIKINDIDITPNFNGDYIEYELMFFIDCGSIKDEIILHHDYHPMDKSLNNINPQKDSGWYKIPLTFESLFPPLNKEEFSELYKADFQTAQMHFLNKNRKMTTVPIKFYCQSGMLREFIITCGDKRLLLTNVNNYSGSTTLIYHKISTIKNCYDQYNNCVYFHNIESIVGQINYYTNTGIKVFDNDEYIQWLNNKNKLT